MPGVIQLEALAQAGAITLLGDERYAGKLALFGGVEKVRFRRVVRPGDELLLEVDVERLSARGGWAQARASVDGDTTCEARHVLRGRLMLSRLGAPVGVGSAGRSSSARSLRSPPRVVVVGVVGGHRAHPRHLAGRLVGVAVEEQLGFDGLVEGWLVPHLPPRGHDDEDEQHHRQNGHDHEDRGGELDGEEGVHPVHYRPARSFSGHPRRRSQWWGRSCGEVLLKRRLMIRRIVSIVALTVIVTALAARA